MSIYRRIFERGYTDLVCVIPPNARLTATSSIAPELLGKIPGRPMTDGSWAGYDYIREPLPDAERVAWWQERGANLGMLAKRYPAIDIDVEDAATAERIAVHARKFFGWAPERRRHNSDRRLLVYRASEPFTKRRFVFEGGAIDVLGDGQQYVIGGVHPSGAAYDWFPTDFSDVDPVTLKDISGSHVDAWFAELRAIHPEAKVSVSGVRDDAVVQGSLRGGEEMMRAVVAAIPNVVRDRDIYIRMGAAIKAALDDTPEAFNLWWSWCERLPDARKSRGEASAEWLRLGPPYAIGAQWLIDEARRHGYKPEVAEFDVASGQPSQPVPTSTDGTKGKSGAVVYSDAWLATRLIDEYGDRLRYCGMLGGWLVWNGSCWAADDLTTANAWAAKVCRAAGRQVALEGGKGAEVEAKRLCSLRVVRDVVAYAKSDPRLVLPVTAFDLDPWLLNTPGGIVDLRTGLLECNDSSRLMTRCTLVAPDGAASPVRWLAFLDEVTRGDKALVAYLQRLAGYSLTGSTREHVMAFLYGPGGNGKGTFLNTLVKLFGTYAKVASMDTFTASKFDRHPVDLADLVGARVVTAQETQEGRAWDETKVKAITGGDPIKARFMRENPFTYMPQFTLLFAGNHRPHFSTVDDAMRRRFHLVPFMVKPTHVDRTLDDKLKPELPGILAWAIQGALAWQRDGLTPPAVVVAATQDYFLSEDPLGRWAKENASPDPTQGTELTLLYTAWREWCGEHEEHPGTEKNLALRFRNMGFRSWPHPTTRRAMFGLTLAHVESQMELASAIAHSPLLD